MFINKRIISLAASLMLFCTCFISQVVAIADDENLNQNAPSIQVFSDDQISETLCSDEIDIEDFYETTSELVLPTSCQIIEEAADKPILIADEPALHLSPELAIPLLQLLQQQASQGKCVLIASRNPQLVAHANQVIDLNKFKL